MTLRHLGRACLTILPALTLALVAAPGPVDAAPAATTPAPTRASSTLAQATHCQPVAELRAARGVVLLVHGTGETIDETWSWNYQPALRADGFATCAVQLPDHGLGSLAVAAEHVRAAVRTASRQAGGPVAVVGHSQGAALAVWAVKFWPRIAERVTDVVGLAGPFGGTQLADELCLARRCAPLAWQLRRGSDHVAALRTAPIPAGVDVSSLFTQYDEIVRPQPAASQLDGAANVLLQDVCVQDPSEHAMILGDPVAYALTLDALTHSGPADPARLPGDTCEQVFIPHGDPLGSLAFLRGVARFATGLADPRRWVSAEPAVPAYARPYVDDPEAS
ncbi:esterase/lipase family protein [Nocardioides ferulae]|uniref:esterase/lipase family protein n=1 Tax=Nocardioides ferulae TaxID=2340821 RepID=UPI0013DDE221|nr:alpha/beta fold hydrolase [Nocardioides ferulae]